jgi:hypothetical protein
MFDCMYWNCKPSSSHALTGLYFSGIHLAASITVTGNLAFGFQLSSWAFSYVETTFGWPLPGLTLKLEGSPRPAGRDPGLGCSHECQSVIVL